MIYLKNMLNASLLLENAIKKISAQDAKDLKLFGPLYHGTTEENKRSIEAHGFKIFTGGLGTTGIRNGYLPTIYANNIPPPVHHLGYGVYFTTSKSIAKRYNLNSGKNLPAYYLASTKIETINFASPNTMMRWWTANGYDAHLAKSNQAAATQLLTDALSSKYDAIWFKGKTIRSVLDGDQVCVYNLDIIRELDPSLAVAGEIGSVCFRKFDGMRGKILDVRASTRPTGDDIRARTDKIKENIMRMRDEVEPI